MPPGVIAFVVPREIASSMMFSVFGHCRKRIFQEHAKGRAANNFPGKTDIFNAN